jgi:hypothetical protein
MIVLINRRLDEGPEVGICASTDGLEIAIGFWVVTPCISGILLDGVTGACQERCDGGECDVDCE